MTISAKIIADSVSPQGHRLTTFQLRYPRFIHAEELTHRVLETQPELIIYEVVADGLMYDQNLSRNASSSRAIPVKRMIEDLRSDPVYPVYWGQNKPGMQAGEEIGTLVKVPLDVAGTTTVPMTPQGAWDTGREYAIKLAEAYVEAGYHKQIVNRLLEPYAHINVVVTATSWSNFFALRAHPDAQPEIKALAEAMQEAMANSVPTPLHPGEWHLPYVQDIDYDFMATNYREFTYRESIDMLKKVSVARCARVSYLTHDGRPTTIEEDVALYEKLVVSQPLHASPAEHQATPDYEGITETYGGHGTVLEVPDGWANPHQHGNFTGWRQLRKMLPNEYVETPLYKGATL